MDVLVLIDKLDDQIHNAKPVPLTDQVRVDKEEVYDILDQMRATIPEEIKQARWIVKERQEMLAEAKREAERILKEARDEQTRLISNEEVVKQAERQAEDIVEEARIREREIRLGAEDYADDILNTLEVNLQKFTAAVQRGRDRLAGREEAEVSSLRVLGRGSCLGSASPSPPWDGRRWGGCAGHPRKGRLRPTACATPCRFL
jgi:cell division septum initiation protein DivIVA